MNTVKFRSLLVALLTACVVTLPANAVRAGAYSDAVLATNPTAYYQMNEDPVVLGTTLDDASPNAKDGVWGYPASLHAMPSNTVPTSGVAGPSAGNGWAGLDAGNLAARYGGNFAPDGGPGDLMDLPNDGTFDNDIATVAFFMKTDVDGNDSRMFTTGTSAANSFKLVYGTTNNYGLPLPVDHDYQAMAIDTGDFVPKQIRSSVFNFRSGEWVHVVAVRNGDTAANAQIYVNGVDLTASLSTVGDDYGTTDPSPHIGNRHGSVQPGFGAYTGDMDELAYWNRALTSAEVSALYAGATVPEPATGVLAVMCLVAAARIRRRAV